MTKIARIETGHRLYTLDRHNNVIPTGYERFIDDAQSDLFIIDRTELAHDISTKILVSTLFLGTEINGAFFETRILGGEFNSSTWRYRHHDEAVQGHGKIVKLLTDDYYRLWT